MQESTGEGICKQFTKEATKRCRAAPDDDEWKEDYCALSEALQDSYGEDEDEDGEEVSRDEEDDDLEDRDDIGSDEDLDNDLIEEDKKIAAEGIEDGSAGDEVVDEHGHSIGKGKPGDRDGDGVPDDQDAFADDPNEWKDTDGDGVGDNADNDLDGDGHDNDVDAFPSDPKEWKDSDNDGIGDNSDDDRDNDGYHNDKDTFPDDPTEWLDSDKDGVGDNKDAYPFNPNCHDPLLPCDDLKKHGGPKKGTPQDPTTLDMDALRPLPDQGYNEHMTGGPVTHNNYYTWTSDWQQEWPEMQDSESSTMSRICKDHPDNSWCQKFKHRDAHFR